MNRFSISVHTLFISVLCVLSTFQNGVAQTIAPQPAVVATSPDIGVGLEGLSDWSRHRMFTDAMKTSRAWGRPDRPWVHEVATDEMGWPTEDAGIVVIADTPGIGGTYKLSFEGRAVVTNVAHAATVANLTYDVPRNTTTADVVVPEKATSLTLAFRNTHDGVKNVRLIRPGADSKAAFSAAFLEKVKPFSTLRYMDFLSTNNNPVKTWEGCTIPNHASQARPQGGAWEYVVELANEADKDLWINIPDQADDDYVRQLAAMLKAKLEPQRKVYVEWSNEVWNWQFHQAVRNFEAAKKEGKAENSPLRYDGTTNEGYWAMRRIAQRSVEVGEVFREVFADKNFERVRPVYATQVGYEEVYKQGLAFLEHHYKQPARVLSGIAGAPYFQISEDLNKKPHLTVEEIFESIPANMERSLAWAQTLGTYAEYYGLKHLAYEGGQHLQDHHDVGNAEVKVAANRDPRMGAMIEEYLRRWQALGSDLFMYFTLSSGYSKWGSWGLVDDISGTSPKYEAVLRVLQSPPVPVSAGLAVPGQIQAGEFAATSHWDKKGVAEVTVEPGKWLQYAVRVPKAGAYRLSFQVSARGNATAGVLLDADKAGSLSLAAGDQSAGPVTLQMKAGLNVFRIYGEEGRFQLTALQVN